MHGPTVKGEEGVGEAALGEESGECGGRRGGQRGPTK